jgi:hypothetical protein
MRFDFGVAGALKAALPTIGLRRHCRRRRRASAAMSEAIKPRDWSRRARRPSVGAAVAT